MNQLLKPQSTMSDSFKSPALSQVTARTLEALKDQGNKILCIGNSVDCVIYLTSHGSTSFLLRVCLLGVV